MQLKFFLAASAASVSLACGMIAAPAMAQETTSIIRGSVVTSDGAPVGDAEINITHVPSGTVSTTRTGADGSFVASGLRVGGPYTVEVTSGAGTTSVTDVYTSVGQPYNLPIELGTEQGAEIVVTASSIKGAGVTSDGPQTVLTQADIAKVASVNRDIRDVQRRDPFANIDLSNSGDRGGAVSFAGVNPRYNRFTINGVTVGDTFGLNQDASPNIRGPVPLDALAQVSVSLAPYDFLQSGFQGGAIDTVLLSGTNRLHGTGFYSINTDELSGKKIGTTTTVVPDFKSVTYGATLSGPIIPDTLFLMVSGERNTDPRPFSTQIDSFVNPTALTNAITAVDTIATSKSLDAGDILSINPRKDEKFAARIDWNVASGQRLSVSYVNSYNVQVSPNNTSTSSTTPSYGLSTNAYALSELLRAGIVQLNSDWTDRLSTEARMIYRWSRRGQEPLGGRPNGQFQVCTDPLDNTASTTACSNGTPRVFFGPDNFRQTNQLFYDTWAGSLLLRYRFDDQVIKFLFDVTENRTFNNFVPNSLGSWYFDSLDALQNGRANQVQYAAVIGSDPNGAAADFHYTQYTFGLQDEWNVTDDLTVTTGLRYSMYGMPDRPVANPYFFGRYGFTNLKTYKGLDQFEPRISFDYKPAGSPFKLRGGAGIFGGGSPDIYLSNSFSNTVTTNSITLTRDTSANGCSGAAGLTPAICAAALNNVTGQVSPVLAGFAGNTTGSSTLPRTNTGAISPNFHLPRALKATLSANTELFGFDIGADYYFSKTIDGVGFTDLRSVAQTNNTLPDGRPRYYNPYYGSADNNYDIMTYNTHKGRSHVAVVHFDKRFDWGLSFGGSYTWQDVKDVSSATSSTINSNYRYQVFSDPNRPTYGISDNQIKWAFKYHLGFDHAFFGDYKTIFQLFGETRAGRTYSFTMLDNTSNRSSVFGTLLTNTGGTAANSNLLYVPSGTNDPLVSYDTTATQDALNTFIDSSVLKGFRGQIAPKNIARNRAFTRIDLHLEQQIPTFVAGSRIALFADINNLPNLINKDWGGLRQFGFPYNAALVRVQCLSAATPTGTAPGAGVTNTVSTQTCAQYRYSSFTAPNTGSVNFNGSLYAIRVGARLTF
ncbi:TonB-dependent receptor [Novosphingobium sp.]|uniref:TonB-dependent receptor n=1 Tax=Novosphingobium sp. TaxID=1874826 RepID=UPI0025FD9587|nr:carboxypeptidase regulatory-like domain-containing protein [Novosphingobium sp.]